MVGSNGLSIEPGGSSNIISENELYEPFTLLSYFDLVNYQCISFQLTIIEANNADFSKMRYYSSKCTTFCPGGVLLYLEWNFTGSLSYDNWFSPLWNLGTLLGQLKFQLGPSIQSGTSPYAGLEVVTDSTHVSRDCYHQLTSNPHFYKNLSSKQLDCMWMPIFQSLSVRCLLRQNLSGNKIDALITVPENFPRNICLGNCKSENLCLFGKILTSLQYLVSVRLSL